MSGILYGLFSYIWLVQGVQNMHFGALQVMFLVKLQRPHTNFTWNGGEKVKEIPFSKRGKSRLVKCDTLARFRCFCCVCKLNLDLDINMTSFGIGGEGCGTFSEDVWRFKHLTKCLDV